MKVFKSAFIITFFSIIARIAGFVRDALIAKFAGVGMMADVFFASFKITNFFRKILAEGTFFAAFVPAFTRIMKEKGKLEMQIFAGNIFSIMFYIVLVITLIMQVFMEEVTALTSPGFLPDAAKFMLTVEVSRVLFWYFVLIVTSSILCGMLNSIKKFTYYAIIPVFLNLALIVFILVFQDKFKTFAHCLAYGVLAGGVMQFLAAYIGCVVNGLRPHLALPSKKLLSPQIRSTFRKMFPAMLAGGLGQVNTLVDLILGSTIVSGVSYLYYTDRIFYLPTSSIGTAIGIVVLPILAHAVSGQAKDDVRDIQTESINLSSIFVLPVAFALVFCSDVFVSVIFERGNFTNENALVVARCLQIMGASLPFCVYMKTLSAIFFANGNTTTPMKITLFCVAMNAAISLSLIKFWGVYGIITGSAISYMLDAAITFILLRRHNLIELDCKKLFSFNLAVIFASICFGAVCFYFFSINSHTSYYANFFEHDLGVKFAYLSAVGALGLVVYWGALKAFKISLLDVISGKHHKKA